MRLYLHSLFDNPGEQSLLFLSHHRFSLLTANFFPGENFKTLVAQTQLRVFWEDRSLGGENESTLVHCIEWTAYNA